MFSKWRYLMPSLLWAAFILTASLLPSSTFPQVNVIDFDKLVHAGIYFVLIFSLWFYIPKIQRLSETRFLLLCAICILFGFTIELLQGSLTVTRQFDWYDVIANSLGVLLFAVIRKFVRKRD